MNIQVSADALQKLQDSILRAGQALRILSDAAHLLPLEARKLLLLAEKQLLFDAVFLVETAAPASVLPAKLVNRVFPN